MTSEITVAEKQENWHELIRLHERLNDFNQAGSSRVSVLDVSDQAGVGAAAFDPSRLSEEEQVKYLLQLTQDQNGASK